MLPCRYITTMVCLFIHWGRVWPTLFTLILMLALVYFILNADSCYLTLLAKQEVGRWVNVIQSAVFWVYWCPVLSWFRWWRRAPRYCAGWRFVLLRLRKEVARMQWTCRRRSRCTSLKHGENNMPMTDTVIEREVLWPEQSCFCCLFMFTSSCLSSVSQIQLNRTVLWLHLC